MKKSIVSIFALVLMCSLTTLASAKSKNINGWVSDSKCAEKGAKAGHADCAKKCMAAGEKMVFVSDKDKSVWAIDNPDALTGHEGHHVRVNATVDADKKSIHVNSAKMLSQGKAKKDSMSEMHDKS
ncbi:MAG TPA: hypothetical protein VGR50_09265 [Terriglobales bacterium]|nr:hypothetical protein [Terriglobales bacterium]